MADVKPLKLVDQGGGAGRLEEFGAGDRVPAENLPATEWSAETVPQAEAEAGTATTRRAWTAQRVRQAIVAWWNGVTTAWGRGFVASADAAAGRTALELGNAATRAVQSSPTDTTAGALMAVGAFGLGSRAVVTDADLAPTGLSILNLGTALNVPGGLSGTGWLETDAELSFTGSKVQRLQTTATGRLFTRTIGVTSWRELFHTGNILGTVSQSSGIPMGAIIERGSNANGEYVRYADGTQICTNSSFAFTDRTTGNGALFKTADLSWTFPATFITSPVCVGKPRTGAVAANAWYGLGTGGDGASNAMAFAIHGATSVAGSGTAMLLAVGRWY